MSSARLLWVYAFASSVCLTALVPQTNATNVPITFEEPTYSATFTHSDLPAGTINTQDGWDALAGLGVGNMNVTVNNPIAGTQSLLVNNSSNSSGAASVRGQTSGLLDVTTPTSMSWLVRVDTLGAGVPAAATSRGVEFGITPDPVAGSTPLTIIFNDAGNLQYYNTSNTNFAGDPTYALGTVYRVEIANISDSAGTYDATIFDNGTNGQVAQVLAAPLQVPVGTAGVHFYALRRGNTTGNAMVDNITALSVSGLPGDFNLDGVVDAADYVQWRKDTPEDQNKYDEWRIHFGEGESMEVGASLGAALPVPEPATIVLIGMLCALAAMRLRSRSSN